MKVLVLGEGRIASAVTRLLPEHGIAGEAEILRREDAAPGADLIISTLPGGLGPRGVEAALRHGKDLIDVADVSPEVYVSRREEIGRRGIRLIAGCGFSPGLVNYVIGWETARDARLRDVEVLVGSTSPEPFHFPFLWCLEDMVGEFLGPSVQVEDSRVREVPAFGGYRLDDLCGFQVESYLSQSGFEDLATARPFRSFTYRTCRPVGFHHFFRYLRSYGFLDAAHLQGTKAMLEGKRHDDISAARLTLRGAQSRIDWTIRCEARASDPLSSMQRLTAGFALAIAGRVMAGEIEETGLISCHELAEADRGSFQGVIEELRRGGIYIAREERPVGSSSTRPSPSQTSSS